MGRNTTRHPRRESDDLAGSCVLELLQEWFSRIPAKRLILFSTVVVFHTALGQKVLHVDRAKPLPFCPPKRAWLSSGAGRIIFTASGDRARLVPPVRARHHDHFLAGRLCGGAEEGVTAASSRSTASSSIITNVRAAAL